MMRLFAGAVLLLLLAACGGGAISEPLPTPAPVSGGTLASLTISTSAFADGGAIPGGGMHGKNSWGNVEYGGPCPPGGPAHTYRFFLSAVDTSLDLSAGASRQQVGEALSGHVLAEGRLTGTYQR